MSRRTVRRSLLAQLMMAALTIAGLYYVGFRVLGGESTNGPVHLTIVAPTSGGLYPKSEVTYRGVRIGTVTSVTPAVDHVDIALDIGSGSDVPVDTAVRITYLSPIGEQLVEFRPRTPGPPYLASGAVLRGEDVSMAAPFSDTLILANRALSSVDPRDVRSIVDESFRALSGHATDLSQTVDDSDRILTALQSMSPSIRRLLLDSRRPLATLNAQAPSLSRFSGAAALVARQLRASRKDLNTLIDEGVRTTGVAHRFLSQHGASMTRALALAMPTIGTLAASFPALRALLPAFPFAMGALARVLRKGSVDAIAIFQGPVLCDYAQQRRSPYDVRRLPIYRNSACPHPRGTLVRGWQNAGR